MSKICILMLSPLERRLSTMVATATEQELLADFLKTWPIERLKNMSIEEYTAVGSEDTYTRWIEARLESLGSIWGGSAFKFGIYKRKSKEKDLSPRAFGTDGTYAWQRKLGNTAQEAFTAVRAGLVTVAEAARRGDLLAIDSVALSPTLKWKTAFLYQDQSRPVVVAAYAEEAVRYLAFGDSAARRTLAEAYKEILSKKPFETDIFSFSANEWKRWTAFQGSVAGLIASDGLEWKEKTRAALEKQKSAVVWWSKRPTGKMPVVNQLKRLLSEKGSFPFYFTRGGKVSHRARVIDIAFPDDYDQKKGRWSEAYEFQEDFEDYTDDTKSAALAFLIDEMEKIDSSLTPNDFTYLGSYSAPTQYNLQPFVSVRDTTETPESIADHEDTVALPSKNVIFYGPPGTGKTFFLHSVLFNRFTKVIAGKSRERWLVETADALSWWKIVAAALYDSGPTSVPEIADHEYIRAKIATTRQASPRAMIWAMLQQHTFADCGEVKYSKRVDPPLFRKDAGSIWSVDKKALQEVLPEVAAFVEKSKVYRSEAQIVERNYEFITFHQSLSYEDFIEGIKPTLGDEVEDKGIGYEIKDGIFKQICRKARLNPSVEYALFIDEINRGNVAGVFGELITLIEDDKREGMETELSAILPYSREAFSVPRNLYIIGTMNSADRSVEALDTALRRRFSFVEKAPLPDLLRVVEGVELPKLLQAINDRLEALRDRDHKIGHAYLINVLSLSSLQAAFSDKIIPLLQEYFYGDWSKIALVLGSAFVVQQERQLTWPRGFEEAGESLRGATWTITSSTTWTADAFRSIYE